MMSINKLTIFPLLRFFVLFIECGQEISLSLLMYIQHKPQSKICPIIYTSSSAFLKIRKEKLLTEILQHTCLYLCFVAVHQLLFHNTDIYLHRKVILGCESCHSAGAPTHNGIRIHQSCCTS